ncbi:MAG: hypothetical protein J5950_01540 [Clostridia bacterium]|nr:hypothetical protein [Clostridia bacterium]
MKKTISMILAAAMALTAVLGMLSVQAESRSMDVSVVGGKIIITAEGEFGEKDWIGIYKQGESADPSNGGVGSIVWWYIGTNGGTVTFPDDKDKVSENRIEEFIDGGRILPGQYKVIAMENDGYTQIADIDPVEVTVEPAEADVAIDYDASLYIGSEFTQIRWNGANFNNYEGGESPLTALKTVLQSDGKVHDEGGTGLKLGLSGWVGFEQDIVAFGSIVNSTVIWDDAFDKGSDSSIRSDEKGGRFAKKYDVEIDISTQTGNYTAGVVVALADGTIVKLNSAADPELSTFISFVGPASNDPADLNIETGDDVDKVPGAVLIFDDEDNYSTFMEYLHDVTSIEYSSELKCFVVTMDNSYDPFFAFSFQKLVAGGEMDELSANDYKVIAMGIRLNTGVGNKGQFFYQTDEHPGYSEQQSVHLTYRRTAGYQSTYIDLREAENWTGTIGECRLDPLDTCAEHCDFEIYYIAFFKTMAGAVEFGQNWENAKTNGTAMEPYATATAAPTAAPTELPSTPAPTDGPAATDAPATDMNVTPAGQEATPDKNEAKQGLGTGAIIGIVIGAAAVIAAVTAGIVISKKKAK